MPATESSAPAPLVSYPARPAVAPTAFKIFHHGNSSFTLVVNDKATDAQLSALVWQLRDAACTQLPLPPKTHAAGLLLLPVSSHDRKMDL
jgi:hypothetical protein